MDQQRLNGPHLYHLYSHDDMQRWVNSLTHSYLHLAWGGHANDPDEFELALTYSSKEDFLSTLNTLGITLNRLPKDHPKPIPGKSYRGDDAHFFKTEVYDFPEYEQPCHIQLAGIKCFCWIENGKIKFTFSSAEKHYEVSETDFQNCKKVDELITKKNLASKVNREVEKSITCISRTRYPEFFVAKPAS